MFRKIGQKVDYVSTVNMFSMRSELFLVGKLYLKYQTVAKFEND